MTEHVVHGLSVGSGPASMETLLACLAGYGGGAGIEKAVEAETTRLVRILSRGWTVFLQGNCYVSLSVSMSTNRVPDKGEITCGQA